MPESSSDRQRGAAFDSTRWSVVLAVGRSDEQGREALATLCQTYWLPLYAYVRRRVRDVHEARDLTQAFFERVLEKDYVSQADPERGRFRAFLLTAFKHFLSKEWDRARALKRGGGRTHLSLDFAQGDSRIVIDPAAGRTAEELYEREWATTLLRTVLDRLQDEMQRAGRADLFERLKGALVGDTTVGYASIAAAANTTEAALRMAASRLRRRYRELLREEIAQTVRSPEEVDDEIRRLFATFS
jgi:RNA polymerase sigma factor (sigma-70 family)